MTHRDAVAVLVIIGLFVLISVVVGISALIFMWAWNLLMPLIWSAAPHLGFWHAVAASVLIGTIRGIFQFSTTVNKKS